MRDISIGDFNRGRLDPEGEHVLRIKETFNEKQASTTVLALSTDELWALYECIAERLDIPFRTDPEDE